MDSKLRQPGWRFCLIVIFCKEVSDHSMIKGEKICKSLLSSARGSFKSSDGEVNFFFQSVSHFVDKKDLHATLYKVSRFIKPWIKNSFYLYILKHIHVKFIRKHFFFKQKKFVTRFNVCFERICYWKKKKLIIFSTHTLTLK